MDIDSHSKTSIWPMVFWDAMDDITILRTPLRESSSKLAGSCSLVEFFIQFSISYPQGDKDELLLIKTAPKWGTTGSFAPL